MNLQFPNIDIISFIVNRITNELSMELNADEYFVNALKNKNDVRELLLYQYLKASGVNVTLPEPDDKKSQINDILIVDKTNHIINNLHKPHKLKIIFSVNKNISIEKERNNLIEFICSDYLKMVGINKEVKTFLFENYPETQV